MNTPLPFSLDHDRSIEDEILLKTALSVVVLRRRALGKAKQQVRFSGEEEQERDANDVLTPQEDPSSTYHPQTKQNENKEDNQQDIPLFQHHPLLAQCPRGEISNSQSFDSCTSSIKEISCTYSISHVQSMANLVIPTTIPLYAMFGSHSKDCGGVTVDSSRKQNIASPIYDFQNADTPSFHDVDHTRYTSNIATYNVLDGLLLHLTSQSSFRDRVYPIIIIPVILPVLTGRRADIEDDDKTMTKKILSLCTALHRFVVLDPTFVEDVVVGVCKTLKMLYRHQLDAECIAYTKNRNSNLSSTTVEHDFNHNVTIKLIDILAVNMIVLLKKVINAQLKCYRHQHASAISQSLHERKNGMVNVEYMMKILHQELGQLLVPVQIEEMASFYVRDLHRIHVEKENEKCCDEATASKTNICKGLNTGGKLMLRLSLYDIVRKIC
jgi:hypothetical protein